MSYIEIMVEIVKLRDSLLFVAGDADDFECIALAAEKLAKDARRMQAQRQDS